MASYLCLVNITLQPKIYRKGSGRNITDNNAKGWKTIFPYPQPPPPLLSHLPQPRLSECVPVSMCCWSIAVKHRITIIVFFHRLQTGQLDPIALSKSANGSCLLSLSRSIDSRYGNNFLSLPHASTCKRLLFTSCSNSNPITYFFLT